MTHVVVLLTLIIVGLILLIEVESYKLDFGLKWGQKCRIPGPNEYLKPSEECEMSKGLNCQVYQQGTLCGCLIRSSLSYDEFSGECRRKPGHHCQYINMTENPGAYDQLAYNHKCHTRAECMIIEPIPEISSSTSSQKKSNNKNFKKEQFSVCRCRPGYKESRDGLECQSVNSVVSNLNNNQPLQQQLLLLTTVVLLHNIV